MSSRTRTSGPIRAGRFRYKIGERIGLKGAIGVYTQPPANDQLSRVFGNPDLGPQTAYHYVAGVDVDITPSLRIETDLFWKDMHDLIVRGEDPDGPVLVNDGRGRAYGAQFMVRKQMTQQVHGLGVVHVVAQRATGSPRRGMAPRSRSTRRTS